MELKTVEDVLNRIRLWKEAVDIPSSDVVLLRDCVEIISNEIKELKKREATNRILIEHEEQVRTTKAKPITGGKNVKTKFKVGDIVDYNPVDTKIFVKSKVVDVVKDKVVIEILERVPGVGQVGKNRWVTNQRLRYHFETS
jgi:hypothetical protein